MQLASVRSTRTLAIAGASAATLFGAAVWAMATPAGAASPSKLPARLTVGATLPLTGPGGAYGKFMQTGLALGLNDGAKLIPGTTFKLVALDDQAQAGLAVSQTRQLINEDKAVSIVTAFTTPPLAQHPLAQRAKVPLFNGGGNDPQLAGKTFLWNDNLGVDQEALAVMTYAKRKLGTKSIGILWETDYTPVAGKAFGKRWEQASGSKPQQVLSIDQAATTAGPQLDKLLANKPDALFLAVDGNIASMVLKQLGQRNVTIPVIGYSAVGSVPEALTTPFKLYFAIGSNTATDSVKASFKKKYPGQPANYLQLQYYSLE